MTKKVKLARLRPTKYIVMYEGGTKSVRYEWAGCKPNSKPFTREVPEEVFEWLSLSTNAISGGALVPVQEELIEELQSDMPELVEEMKKNAHTRDEIVEILKGNINKMKKVISEITSSQEKQFVLQVMREIEEGEGLNSTKVKFIKEWAGIVE